MNSRIARGSLYQRKYIVVGIVAVIVCGLVLGGQVQDMRSLLASTTSALGFTKQTLLFFTVHEDQVYPGDTITVDVRINAGTPINVVGATISYDPDALLLVGVNKETSILDLWTEEVINHLSGTIRLSGGTVSPDGHVGPGTIITLVLRTKKEGTTNLAFDDSQVYAHDGRGTIVTTDRKPSTITVSSKSESAPSRIAPVPQNSDLNNDGQVTLADVSIFAVQLFTSYHARYDLNRDGRMDIGDLSIIFSAMSAD